MTGLLYACTVRVIVLVIVILFLSGNNQSYSPTHTLTGLISRYTTKGCIAGVNTFWGFFFFLTLMFFHSVTHNFQTGWEYCFLIFFSDEVGVFACFLQCLSLISYTAICSLGSSLSLVCGKSPRAQKNKKGSMYSAPEGWGTKCTLKRRGNIQDTAERFNFPSLSKKREKLFL